MLPTLDARLAAAAELVRPGQPVADIGCDHGKLTAVLAASGRYPKVIGADLRPGPLSKARQTLEHANCQDRAELRLGDGLSVLSAGEVGSIVLAGVSAQTTWEILEKAPPVIPRRKIFYKGKELEEMDLDTIIRIHPEIVIVDELAHTNVEGSRNEKRWQDVMDLLDEGINVISAVNIQHIESINEEVQGISGIEVKERIPDSVLEEADEVVNIDLTAEELITRLKAGKIYRPDKVAIALNNFFKTENILQLRELALNL